MSTRRLIGALAALVLTAVGLLAVATPAQATDCRTVHTVLDGKPDSGAHGDWADDHLNRGVVVCQTEPGTYHAVLTDTGTFAAREGAKSPGAGVDLPAGVTGSVKGGFTADFTAAADWVSFDASAVDGKTFTGTAAPATATWVKGLFGDDFEGSSINADWKWTYASCAGDGEQWVNADEKVGGNSGDITGTACPTTAPTTGPTTAPTTPATNPPAGGAGASDGGGSLPVTGAKVSVMLAAAIVLLGAGVALYLTTRRRRTTFTS